MNEFVYHNIFETKGSEYLLTILFFTVLIPFWILLNREKKPKAGKQKEPGILTFDQLKMPAGLLLSKNHTWMHLEKNGIVKMGLDVLIPHITGPVEFSPVKKPGDMVQKGEYFADLIQNNRKLKISSPISGKMVAFNNGIYQHGKTEITNTYQNVWLTAIEPSNWIGETNQCLMAEDASKWAFHELERYKDFLMQSIHKHRSDFSTVALQDGGELRDHTLSELPEDIWKDFQREFLD